MTPVLILQLNFTRLYGAK